MSIFVLIYLLMLQNLFVVADYGKDSMSKNSYSFKDSSINKKGLENANDAISKIQELENRIAGLESLLDPFQKAVEPDIVDLKKGYGPYWSFNEGTNICRGEIRSQTGRIFVNPYTFGGSSFCVYTIQANYRSWIKMSFDTDQIEYANINPPRCVVRQIMKWTSGSQSLNITTAQWRTSYLFKGPMISLQCAASQVLHSSSNKYIVDFEGLGVSTLTNYNFHHYRDTDVENGTLLTHTEFKQTNINTTSLKDGENQNEEPEVVTVTFTYNAVYAAKELFIQSIGGPRDQICSNKTTLILDFESSMDSTKESNIIDCCNIDCGRTKFIINNNAFIFYSSQTPRTDAFRFIWNNLPFSYGTSNLADSVYKITKGLTTQSIREVSYGINERNVWLIHPYPRSKIVFNVVNHIEPIHDQLVALIIGDDDVEQFKRMKITHLGYPHNFILHGRTALVMFISDNYHGTTEESFDISWQSLGPLNLTNMQFDDHLHSFTTSNDSYVFNRTTETKRNNVSWPGSHIFVINPTGVAPLTLNLNIEFKIRGAVNLYLLNSKNATFTKLISSQEIDANQDGHRIYFGNYTSWDAVFVIVVHFKDGSGDIDLSFDWSPGETTIPNHYYKCGGNIKDQKTGRIAYKASSRYMLQEECFWTLQCPGTITLKMIKHGFCCNSSLLINDLDQETLKFKDNSTVITYEHQEETFEGHLIFISFHSNSRPSASPPLTRKGFVLEFNCSSKGDSNSQYEFLETTNEEGELIYPPESVVKNDNNDTSAKTTKYSDNNHKSLIFTRSIELSDYGNSLYPKLSADLHLHSLGSEVFGFFGRLTIYNFSNGFHPMLECEFLMSSSTLEECNILGSGIKLNEFGTNSSDVQKRFGIQMRINNTGIVAIYKAPEGFHNDSGFGFNFSWEHDMNCGGVIKMEGNGYLDYKWGVAYDNNEFCIWLLEVPAKSITFSLLTSSLEYGHDVIYVSSVVNGLIAPYRQLARRYYGYSSIDYDLHTVTVTTPQQVALMIFKSDSSIPKTGFRIQYKCNGYMENYIRPTLFHSTNVHKHPSFSLPLDKNGPIQQGATYLTAVAPKRLLKRLPINVSLEVLDLHVTADGSNCVFDTLAFYDTNYISDQLSLIKSFRPYQDNNCSLWEESNSETIGQSYDYDTTQEYLFISKGEYCREECYDTNVLTNLVNHTFILPSPFVYIYSRKSNETLRDHDYDVRFSLTPQITNTTTAI